MRQAESWLSVAELAARRDEALGRAEAYGAANRVLGEVSQETVPALAVLRESAHRLSRLATRYDGPDAVDEIVAELYSVERAVASLLGAIALASDAVARRAGPHLHRLGPDRPGVDHDRPARGRRRSVIRRGRNLPLAAWAAIGGAATVVTMVVLVGAVLARGGLDRLEYVALGAGLLVGLLLVSLAVLWTRRVTAGMRELHADAVRRLRDPSLRVAVRTPRLVGATTEFAELARVLDALHLRARVADEVAEQSRRTAEQTSAGVFELLSGLVAAEEATRGQLSAELHDTVAQSLAAARSLLADSDPERPDPAKEERVRELVEDAEEQVRAVMARTRPAELRDGDLASAVGALRREFATRYLVTVRLSWPEEAYPLPLVSAVTVYRFFQEALLNVVKHADVDEAEASLAVEGDQIVATVTGRRPRLRTEPGAVQRRPARRPRPAARAGPAGRRLARRRHRAREGYGADPAAAAVAAVGAAQPG